MGYFPEKPHVRPAILHDICRIKHALKPAEVRSFRALKGPKFTNEQALLVSYVTSTIAFTVVDEKNRPVAMFGVCPITEEKGLCWMLPTIWIDRIKKSFMKESLHWIKQLQKVRPYLFNYTDERNEDAIKWLRWCGFKESRRLPKFGKEELPFIEHYKD